MDEAVRDIKRIRKSPEVSKKTRDLWYRNDKNILPGDF